MTSSKLETGTDNFENWEIRTAEVQIGLFLFSDWPISILTLQKYVSSNVINVAAKLVNFIKQFLDNNTTNAKITKQVE